MLLKTIKSCMQTIQKSRYVSNHSAAAVSALKTQLSDKQEGKLASDKYQPGTTYYGFKCKTAEYIPDFNMTAYMFEHNKLKSKYLHIDRNDSNNVFSINFRTTPFDSTGIPHILEHSVLCGSEKFPVRDPFFKMINRSVATFMNAMTGPDYTLYPFSSMNETDFRQLLTVYLDAVFKPNLNYLDFLQEGWRLENSDLNNIDSEYVIKGVVYNEMKGAFSENSNLFSSKFLNEILPDHTYGHCSGGDPLAIPDLTHENLVAFHNKYYHPSNARFFSYGNFPLQTSLKYIDENYLNNYEPIATEFSKIPKQKRWIQPKKSHIVSRFDNMGAPIERQHQIAIGYLLSDITDTYETLLLNVLTELLVKGPNSPFYQNLIEPNFCGGYSQMTGFESSIRDTMFVVGLQDVEAKDFEKITDIFDKTIDQVIQNGFDADHVNSVLNSIELGLKHQSPKFGLGLLFNLTPIWNHDGDIIQSVQFGKLMQKIRDHLKDPKYLQKKVQEYFKNSQHKLIFTMSPDVKYEQKFTEAEQNLIKSKVGSLNEEDRKKIFKNGHDLAENQKSPQNLELLPCLKLNDVKNPPPTVPLQQTSIGGVPTQLCVIDTNNVSYINGIFCSNNLSTEQKLLLPILSNVLDQMGTKHHDYRQFDKYITTNTSGVNFSLHVTEKVDDLSKFNIGFGFSTYCLEQNIPKMFDILYEVLQNFNFTDVERFDMLLKNYASALSVGIANSGHLYAMQSAGGLVNEAANLRNQLSGIEHIDYIRNLMQQNTPEEILNKLRSTAQTLFSQAPLKAALNTSDAIKDNFINEYSDFVGKTITAEQKEERFNWLQSNVLPPSNLHSLMTIPVNYCAKSLLAVPYSHNDFPALQVLGKILTSKYLLPVVREQNGAYGAGAKIGRDGLFSFYSYRDPNARKTLDTFDQSVQWLRDNWNKIDDQLLFESKLGVLQQIDAPISPGSRGLDKFIYGIEQDVANAHRLAVLNVCEQDLDRVIELHLKDRSNGVGRFVLGPENKEIKGDGEKWTVRES